MDASHWKAAESEPTKGRLHRQGNTEKSTMLIERTKGTKAPKGTVLE